jgi:hypothetical protein
MVYVLLACLVLSCMNCMFAPLCYASQYAAAEGRSDILHRITHLPMAAYLVMFLVVILAVANLIYQGWISKNPLSLPGLGRNPEDKNDAPSMRKRKVPAPERTRTAASAHAGNLRIVGIDAPASEIVGIRRVEEEPAPPVAAEKPTPLEGVDHPLPDLAAQTRQPPGAPRTVDPNTPVIKPAMFRFTSAVEVPSREEVQRREKEKLVVAGSVRHTDGTGLASVLVYLTDEKGRRVGQSARSREDTGDFKVIANEPGRYKLEAYKRGFVVESNEPMFLPIESGRIEGYMFRMAPEGCAVQGKILGYSAQTVGSALTVRCLDEEDHFSRNTSVDSSGGFKIEAVPPSTECILEVVDPQGMVIARSLPFSTRNQKDVSQEIRLPSQTFPNENKTEHDVMWTEAGPKKDKPSETPHLG